MLYRYKKPKLEIQRIKDFFLKIKFPQLTRLSTGEKRRKESSNEANLS
jgi:hypothetical protein